MSWEFHSEILSKLDVVQETLESVHRSSCEFCGVQAKGFCRRRGDRHQLAILSHKHVEELRQEIVSQQSTVLLNKEGILEPVAAVTTLRVTRSDGRMLVQVGKWKGNHLVPACQLPGGKPEPDETPQDTLDRLIETKLEFLIDCLSVQECTFRPSPATRSHLHPQVFDPAEHGWTLSEMPGGVDLILESIFVCRWCAVRLGHHIESTRGVDVGIHKDAFVTVALPGMHSRRGVEGFLEVPLANQVHKDDLQCIRGQAF